MCAILLLPALAEDARRYPHQLKTEDSAPHQPPMPFRRLGNGSVLGRGPPGSFDACQAKYPSVLKFNDTWMMWYNGRADDCFTGSVGLATSRGPGRFVAHCAPAPARVVLERDGAAGEEVVPFRYVAASGQLTFELGRSTERLRVEWEA